MSHFITTCVLECAEDLDKPFIQIQVEVKHQTIISTRDMYKAAIKQIDLKYKTFGVMTYDTIHICD